MLKKLAIATTGAFVTGAALFGRAFGSPYFNTDQDRYDIRTVVQNFFQGIRNNNEASLSAMLAPTVRLLLRVLLPSFLLPRALAPAAPSGSSTYHHSGYHIYPGTYGGPPYSYHVPSHFWADLAAVSGGPAYTPSYASAAPSSAVAPENILEGRLEAIHFNEDDIPEGYKDPVSYSVMDNPVRAYYKLAGEANERAFICDRSTFVQLGGVGALCPTNRQPFLRVENDDALKTEITNFVEEKEKEAAEAAAPAAPGAAPTPTTRTKRARTKTNQEPTRHSPRASSARTTH